MELVISKILICILAAAAIMSEPESKLGITITMVLMAFWLGNLS